MTKVKELKKEVYAEQYTGDNLADIIEFIKNATNVKSVYISTTDIPAGNKFFPIMMLLDNRDNITSCPFSLTEGSYVLSVNNHISIISEEEFNKNFIAETNG